jgi:hypothetical protein
VQAMPPGTSLTTGGRWLLFHCSEAAGVYVCYANAKFTTEITFSCCAAQFSVLDTSAPAVRYIMVILSTLSWGYLAGRARKRSCTRRCTSDVQRRVLMHVQVRFVRLPRTNWEAQKYRHGDSTGKPSTKHILSMRDYVLSTDGGQGSQRLLSSVHNAYTSCQDA